jgi:hypothetical protein
MITRLGFFSVYRETINVLLPDVGLRLSRTPIPRVCPSTNQLPDDRCRKPLSLTEQGNCITESMLGTQQSRVV